MHYSNNKADASTSSEKDAGEPAGSETPTTPPVNLPTGEQKKKQVYVDFGLVCFVAGRLDWYAVVRIACCFSFCWCRFYYIIIVF